MSVKATSNKDHRVPEAAKTVAGSTVAILHCHRCLDWEKSLQLPCNEWVTRNRKKTFHRQAIKCVLNLQSHLIVDLALKLFLVLDLLWLVKLAIVAIDAVSQARKDYYWSSAVGDLTSRHTEVITPAVQLLHGLDLIHRKIWKDFELGTKAS